MNWCGGAWPDSKIPAKSSLIQTRIMLGRKSARKHSFREKTHGSARLVSRPGSLSPRHKNQLREDWLPCGQTEVSTRGHGAVIDLEIDSTHIVEEPPKGMTPEERCRAIRSPAILSRY